jgi:hypothetical protein
MVIKFLKILENLAGGALGGIAISVQVGNVLICMAVLCFGPALILGRLSY